MQSLSPAKVTSFIAEIYDSSSVLLYWSGNSTLNRVSLQQSTNDIKYYTLATDLSTNQYGITGLKNNIYYYFRIIPYDVLGNSGRIVKTNVYLKYNLEITSFYTGTSTGLDMPLYWKGNYYGVNLQYKLSEYDDTAYSDTISVIGTNTYTITGLDEKTEYDFKITPKYASGSISNDSRIITASTDYIASFSNFTLDHISSFEAAISWVGNYSFIKFQYSTTGVGFKTFCTANSEMGDVSGTVTMTNLLPYTRYYFRAIPYNTNLNAGITSNIVSGETLSGIKNFTASRITQTYSIISWIGSYITAYLYKSTNGGQTYQYLQTYTDTSGSFTDTEVLEYTPYYYYLQPYGQTMPGVSSELFVLTDYYSIISVTIDNSTTNSIIIIINSNGSRFKTALIQISPDNGITYYKSTIVSSPGTYTLNNATGLGDLLQNTIYYLLITPYSLYNTGTSPFTGSIATLGSISTFDLSVNSLTSIYLSWTGFYSYSRIEYSTDSTFSSGVTTITTGLSSYTINSIDTKFTTYYFRIMPININNVDGAFSDVLYNPTVNTLYYSDITSSFATLNWSGTNTATTVQISTDGGITFSDLTDYIVTTETTAIIPLNGTTAYARVIPYNNDIIGTVTNTIYAPYSNGLTIASIASFPSTITFNLYEGVYKTVKLQYATTLSSTSYTDISTNIVANTIIVGTNLLPTLNTQNKTYYYSVVPYSIGYQSGVEVPIAGNISSPVFNPSITSIYISDITASTGNMTLNWSGTFTRVILYESTNNITYYPIYSITNANRTSYIITAPANSISNAANYYKIIPICDFSGVFSDMVYNPVVADISVVSLSTSTVKLGWTGTYGNITIQSSTISSTSGFSDLFTNITEKSIIVSGITPASIAYYFRAIPYSPGVGTSASYKITGVTSATIYNPVIKTISITNIASNSLTLNWTGIFGNVSLQSSSDNSVFSNLPSGNTYITGTSKTLSLSTSTTKYYRIVPYYISVKTGNYIPGLNSSVVYNPTITNLYIGSITNTTIGVFWTGTYDYIKLQYSVNGTSYTDISSIVVTDNVTINSSNISDINTQYQTYYFRVVPYSKIINTDGTTSIAIGLTTDPTYTPTIQTITISSVNNSSILLNWSGTYNNVTIQSSSDGNTFYDLYTGVSASSKSISTIGTTTTYYRVKPYNNSSPSVNGIITPSVYIPTVLSIEVTSVTKIPATIALKWTGGTYDKTAIQYSTDNTTFTNLVTNIIGDTTIINSSNISGLNTQTGTYYFRAVPYSYGYNNGVITYDIIGLNTNSVFNATVSSISTSTPVNNSTNTISVNYIGKYSRAILYYGTPGNITTNSIIITTPNVGSNVTTNVSNLISNTNYEFEIYPYNATDVPGIMSSVVNKTTVSTIYGLYFVYNLSLSSAYNIGLSWTNNGYTRIEIYNTTGDVLVKTLYSNDNPRYNSSGIETLAPNSSYSYYAKVYDSINNVEQCPTVTTYTLATADSLNLLYSNVSSNDSITITWNNSGYTTFSIYNYTLYGNSPSSGKITTITSVSNITTYNSYDDIGDTLEYNTSYVYHVTLTNMVGELVYTNITVTTLASATLSVSTNTANFTSSRIPLVVSGSYSGFKIYVNDDSTGTSVFSNYVVFDGSAIKNVAITSENSIINSANNQYSFKLQPYNAVGTYSAIGTSVSAKTLGTITSFYISSVYDSSSINLFWDGSFDSVGVESSTSSNFSNNFVSTRYMSSIGGVYNIPALRQNTKYYFRVTPINNPLLNGDDISGITIINDVSGTTLGTISSFNIGSLNDLSENAISLAWDGSYSAIYIQISSDGGATYTSLSDKYYGKYATIRGLKTYTQYYFQGLPINDVGLLNYLPSRSATAQTLGSISTFYTYSVKDSSNITIFYDGSYDVVVLERSTSANFNTNYTLTRITGSSTRVAYTVRNLEANKKYYFRVRPISYPLLNGVDACGNIVTNDVSGTTYACITNMSIGDVDDIYSHAIPVTWDGSFSKVYIYYSNDGSRYTLDINSPYTNNYAIIYNLDTYLQYYFVAIPENSNGIISDISSTVVTAKTLGTINSFYNYSVVDSSSINIYVDGSYSAVCIECFGGNTGYISRRFVENVNNIYYYTGLTANTTYTFLATPLDDPLLNGVDVSGITIDNNITGTTWGNIISFSTKSTDISSTYIPLAWSGVFSSIFLEYTDSSTFAYDISSYIVYNNSGTIVRDLSSSKLYYFRITPINSLNVYGATSNIISDYTLGSSSTISVASNSVYNIRLYIAGGSYTKADINVSLNQSMTPYTVYSNETYAVLNNNYYTIRDLSSNIAYYFTLTPYNAANVKGSSSNRVTSTTLGNLTSFSLNASTYATTSSSIAVKWTGIYANVYLEDAASSISSFSPVGYITDTSANVSNLSPNTRYYFRATPVNSAGNKGATIGEGDISNVTLATITSQSVTTIGDVSANIAFDGSFNTIRLFTSDNAINQTYGTSVRNSGTDISGLIPLTTYNVSLNSYNLNNVLSQTASIVFTTLPKISRFTITTASINTTYIPVSWDGSFNSVKFQWSKTSGIRTYSKTVDVPTLTTNITDLSRNTYYYIIATPYANTGGSGVAGYTFTELNACTLPELTRFAIDTIQSTTYYSIPVSWTGYYKNVVIEYSTNNTNFVSLGAKYDTSVNLTGLDANKRYYFRATPVNLADVSGTTIFDISSVTLGNMNSPIYSVYDTSAVFTLDGSFDSISIYSVPASLVKQYPYRNGGVSTGTDISGLLPNATYTFTITPINSVNISRTDPTNITFKTLPKIYAFNAVANDVSNITVTWDGSFDSVDIYTSNTAGSYTGTALNKDKTIKSTVFNNLFSNKKYYFKIVPNGTAGNGYSIIDVSAITYSIITKFLVSSYYDTSAIVAFDGSYDSISIVINGITIKYSKIGDTGTDISNLIPYTNYIVSATSTNTVITSNVISTSFTTLPKISDINVTTNDFSSVNVYWSYSGNAPTNIKLEWNKTDDTFTTIDNSNTYYSSPIYIPDLSANRRYYFRATPYGSSSGYGYPVKTSVLTGANAGIFIATEVYDTSAVITFDGVYTSIDISVNNVTSRYNTSSGTTGKDISNLIPNTSYLATSIVKVSDGTTSVGNNTTFITLPKLTDLSVSTIDNSSVYVYWKYTGNAPSSVALIWNTTGITYSTATDSNKPFDTSPAYISGLLSNAKYYFKATPIGPGGSGYPIKDASNYTFGKLTSLTATATYDTSAVVSFDGSFASVDISVNGVTTTYTTQRNTGMDISGLIPGTQYNVTTIVKNATGYTRSSISTTFTTWTKITDFSAVPIDISSMYVYWRTTGVAPAKVNIIWNTAGGTYNTTTDNSNNFTTSPAYISYLSLANAKYYFQITPITSAGDMNGYSLRDSSNVTYGKLTSLTAATYDTSAVVAFDGSFASVDISVNGVTTTYTAQRNTGTDITNLIPGTQYTVTTNVKNATGYTRSSISTTFTTWAKITSKGTNPFVDSSCMQVNWTAEGSPTSVRLTWNTTGTFGTISDSSDIFYTSPSYIIGLLANTRYFVVVTPILNNVEGYTYNNLGSKVTYGKLTSFYISSYTDTSAIVSFDGSFTSVDISVNSVTNTYTIQRNTGSNIINLTPGTQYTAKSIIRNSDGNIIPGATATFTTWSKIRDFSAVPIDISSMYVYWSTIGDVSRVNLIWNTTGGTYNTFTDSSNNFTASPAYVPGLTLGNVKYYFQITPISTAGTGYSVRDASNYTFGKLTSLTYTNYDTSAVVAFDGSFASVDITVNGVTNTYTIQRNTGTDINNLTPGTLYNVTTNVKNSTGYSVPSNSISFTTRPKIASYGLYPFVDSSCMEVTWTAQGSSPSSITITWNSVGTFGTPADSSNIFYTSPSYVIGLLANTRYYFQITPTLNNVGDGYTYNNGGYRATYGKLTSFYISSYTDTTAVVSFDGSFASVDISVNSTNSVTNTYTIQRNTGSNINNLTPGTQYTATSIIRNLGGLTIPGSTAIFTTWAKIRDFSAIPIDISSMYVYWRTIGDAPAKVNIIWNTTGGTYDPVIDSSNNYTASPAYVPGLVLGNVKYYFQITPITSAGDINGYPLKDASNYTFASVTNLTPTTYDTSAVIAFDGSFVSVDISVNGITTSYTTQRDTGTNISGLTPGTQYTVTTNAMNATGYKTSSISTTFTTWAKIRDFSAVPIDFSSMYVYWRTIGVAPANVNIIWNTAGVTYDPVIDSSNNYTASPAYVTGLELANKRYFFKITPITSAGDINGYSLKDASNVTAGKVTSFYVSSYTDTTGTIVFDGSFASVDISANNNKNPYTTQRTYTITGLTTGRTYNVVLDNIRNSSGYSNVLDKRVTSFTTVPIIVPTATSTDSSSITISWTPTTFSKVNIAWNTSNTFSITDSSNDYISSPAIIGGLSQNITYYFRLTPYYSGNTYVGVTKDVSYTTLFDFSGIIFALVAYT